MSSKKVTALSVGRGAMGALYHLAGAPCEVTSVTRGWAMVKDYAGRERKVRSTEVVLVLPAKEEKSVTKAVAESVNNSSEAQVAKAKKTAKAEKKTDVQDKSLRKVGKSVYNPADYVKTKAASGGVSLDNDDPVARKLRSLDLTDVYKIAAEKLDVSVRTLKEKYSHLNSGMQRMNLGNRLRGQARGQ